MEHDAQYAPVPALARATLVLKAVFESGGLPAKELAHRCPCPKTTFYRLLAELVHSGYLCEDEQTKLYTPGPLFEQGFVNREEQQARLKELAGPVLEQLALQSGQTVKLNIACGRACCVAALALGPQKIRITVDEGTRYPLHTGAAGKLLLAYQGRRLSTIISKYRPSPIRPSRLRTKRGFKTLRGISAARAMPLTRASLSRRWGPWPARCAGQAAG